MKKKSTVLILGVTGMLGHTLFRVLSQDKFLHVIGTARNKNAKSLFPKELIRNILTNIDVLSNSSLTSVFNKTKPDVVINCVGLIKQISEANDFLQVIPINTLLPHRLVRLSQEFNARLILMSTDCVFSGEKGNYTEADSCDCNDLYGQSKQLGEVIDEQHVLTIRTSIIGHELRGHHSLVNWFLKQKGVALGYTQAIYSGLTTVELSNIIHDLVLPNLKLNGLYQIASESISKFELLSLIARVYQKKITLQKARTPKINRSLNFSKFKKKTGYKPKPWKQLIEEMHNDYLRFY